MKLTSLILTLILSVPVFAADLAKSTTLANEGDFVIISDVEASEISVFLSYTGKQFNHCGISLRSHGFSAQANDLKSVLSITSNAGDISLVEGRKLVAKIGAPVDVPTFGEYFTIKTKSGLGLKEALSALNAFQSVPVIVENLACD